jgi:hypothetical protein
MAGRVGDTMNEAVRYVSWEDYVAVDATNWSALKELRRSALHYRHRLANPSPDTPAFALGRAVHAAVFERFRFAQDFVQQPASMRRVGKSWDAFALEHAGRTILTAKQYEFAETIGDAVQAHPLVAPYLRRGRAEHSVRWTDRETGITCKSRLDWIADGMERTPIVELKTATSIELHRFAGAAARYGYNTQMAMQRDGLTVAEHLTFEPPCVIVAVESEPPHDIGVFPFNDDALYAGAEEYRDLLRRLAIHRARDEWPGRYVEPVALALPAWALPLDDDEGGMLSDLTFATSEDV